MSIPEDCHAARWTAERRVLARRSLARHARFGPIGDDLAIPTPIDRSRIHRVAQISDTHLSRRRAYTTPAFDAVVARLNADPPDLVVNTGDIVLDDPDISDDHVFARECHDRIHAPVVVVPGNHDVGDSGPEPWQDQWTTAERVSRFVDVWGADRWARDLDDWLLVGVNGLLFGSGLDAAAEQEEWLAGRLHDLGTRRLAVFTHKPPIIPAVTGTSASMSEAATADLGRALGDAPVALVASGHLHVRGGVQHDMTSYVWAPSTALVRSPGAPSEYGGTRTTGFVEYDFIGPAVTWRFVDIPLDTAVDVTPISERYGAFRFAPELPA